MSAGTVSNQGGDYAARRNGCRADVRLCHAHDEGTPTAQSPSSPWIDQLALDREGGTSSSRSATPEVETIRQRTLHVGTSLERDAVKPPISDAPTEARSIERAIDGGHVKAVRSYQGRSFEFFVAPVGNDGGKRVVFSTIQ